MIGVKFKNAAARLHLTIEMLPVALAAALAVFGLVATGLLLVNQLRSEYVWPLGLAAAALAVGLIARFYPRDSTLDRERQICNGLVLLGVLVWVGFNFFFTAQHMITDRDPGTYANAAVWLADHDSARIEASKVFEPLYRPSSESPGFSFASGREDMLPQGLHLLPVLLGLGGRLVGVDGLLHLNLLFGMTALLAVYAFARVLARPYWALIVTAVLAASMPFIYFSRDTYTEPLAATFTFGALVLLWAALKSRATSLWLLAGLVAGAGTLTRIDGYLTIAALIFFLGIMLALSEKDRLAQALKGSMAMLVGMAAAAVVGWLDLSMLSTRYFVSQKGNLLQELVAIAAALVFTILALLLVRRSSVLARLDKLTRPWRASLGAVAVIVVALVLASRPLWYIGYEPSAAPGVPPERSLAEFSVEWVAWYVGPLLAALGALGLALAVAQVLKRRNMILLAAVILIGGTALVYLTLPNIAPDQVWASRRLVPVILPGVAVFAALMLDWLDRRHLQGLRWKSAFIGLAGVGLLLAPLITSRPIFLAHDTALMKPVKDVCAVLPSKAIVLWVGMARSHFVQPTRGVCGSPAEGYGALFSRDHPISREVLKQVAASAAKAGHQAVIGLYAEDTHLLPQPVVGRLTVGSVFIYERLEKPVHNPPQRTTITNQTLLLGAVQPDGSLKAL